MFVFELDNIDTSRLLIRKMKLSDANDYFEWRSNPDYHTFLPSNAKNDLEYYKQIVHDCVDSYNSDNPSLFYVIELKSEHKVIGCVSIENINEKYKNLTIGWGLNLNFQGNGYAYEAVSTFIDYIFNNYDIHRIQISIWAGNEKSINLAKKLGFIYEGTGRESRYKNGKFIDNLNFGLLKHEWKNN